MIAMRIKDFRRYLSTKYLGEQILVMYRNKVIGEWRPRIELLECGVKGVELQCCACGEWTKEAREVMDQWGDARPICRNCYEKVRKMNET